MDPSSNPSVKSIAEMFHGNTVKFGSKTLYLSKRAGTYRGLTYRQVGEIVSNLALGLASLGIKKNDKVAIICPTQEEWAMTDYAVLSLGAVTVPIYPNLPPKQVEYILQNSDSKIIFASDAEQLQKVISVKENCRLLTHAVLISAEDKKKDYVLHFSELQELGKKFAPGHANYLENAVKQVAPGDLATIIYTSGTTGTPKGVMLTHNNLLSNAIACSRAVEITNDDTFLSFLPLSHIFERTGGHNLPVFSGCAVAYAENLEKVAQNMTEIHPTIMTAVPRLYEKMYTRVQDGVASAPKIRQKIFHWAVKVGKEARASGKKGLSYKIADHLVYSKLRARFGGRLKYFISGGAPLSKEIAEFFASMSVVILEAYGLTESSPAITGNRPNLNKIGTVGCPFDGIQVKIAPDGEILTKGPHVMVGYYKDEAATKEVIDAEGWLHTGDLGFLDADNYLTITDRKKNIIVTSGGKNVAPQPIENMLITIPYVEQAMVIGDKRNFVAALIVPKLDKLQAYAKENNIPFSSDEELIQNQQIYDMVNKLVQDAQEQGGLARYEKVRKFAFLPKAFTIESGELTPTLKIKRNVVTLNFQQIIESIYNKETERLHEKE